MTTLAKGSGAFIGRHQQLADLVARRKVAASGHGSVVLVSGEAGCGKTRLLEEFATTLTHGRGRVLWVSPNEFAQAGMQATIQSALEARSRRSTAIVVEDAHCASPELLDVLVKAGKAAPHSRLLLVVTYRPAEIAQDSAAMLALAKLARIPGAGSIEVETLDREEARAFMRALLDEGHSLRSVAFDAIEARSGGNPLLLRELLAHAVRCADDPEAAEELPLSVRGLVSEWLAPFPEDERRVLQHAALMRGRFAAGDIAALFAVSPEVVGATLQRARARNLVIERRDGRGTYAFRYRVVAEMLERGFLAHETQALHARIAQAIEASGSVEARAGELAQHWQEAGNGEMAAAYAEKAGDRAFAMDAYGEAAGWYERAAAAARGAHVAAHVYEKLARSLDLSGNPLASHAMLRTAATGFEASGDAERAVRLRLYDALIAQYQSLPAGLSRLESATRFGLSATSQRYAQAVAAFLLALRQETDRALELIADFPRDGTATEPAALLKYWEVITCVAAQRCDSRTFDVAAAKCLELARLGRDHAAMTESESNVAISAIHFGGVACDELLERSIAMAQEHGLARVEAYTRAFAAVNDFVRGRLESSRRHVNAMLPLAADTPMTVVARMYAGLSTARALCDDELLASCARPDLLESAFGTDAATVFGRVAGPYAQWLADAGRSEEARAVLHRCVSALRSAYGTFLTMPVVAKYAGGDDVVEARGLLETAAANPEDRIAASTLALFDALWEERTGNLDASREAASAAAGRFADIGWTGMQAWAVELGGDRAEALRLYRQCGNTRALRRLELAVAGADERFPTDDGHLLSARERHIVALVTAGKSNRAIAAALSLSEKTVERHLTTIFEKLGFRSRTELAASAVAQTLTRS